VFTTRVELKESSRVSSQVNCDPMVFCHSRVKRISLRFCISKGNREGTDARATRGAGITSSWRWAAAIQWRAEPKGHFRTKVLEPLVQVFRFLHLS
jgi:hypothetical protein